MLRTRVGLALVIVVAAGALAPSPAGAAKTTGILDFYNADRAANGLPIVSVVNAQMELGCANHDHYMALNNSMEHGEDPSKPGYTPEGNYQNGADGGEVLAAMPGWSASFDPWGTAPIHAYELFDPSVYQVGYADGDGYVCMRMRGTDAPASDQPAPPVFYAWTSDSGRKDVPYSVHEGEYPYTPQQLVGIPATAATGPNILLFSDGDQGVPLTATLTGPQGPVDTALINVNTKNSVGDGGWFYGGGVLVPVKPLLPSSSYTATVTWDDNGTQTQTFSFTTSRRIGRNGLVLKPQADRRGRWRFLVKTPARNAVIVMTGPKGRTLHPRVRRGVTPWLTLPHGIWSACATSGGGSSGYQEQSSCVQLAADGPPAPNQ